MRGPDKGCFGVAIEGADMTEVMQTTRGPARRVMRGVVLGVALFALAACAERIRNHGYVPTDDDLSQITVGVDTRDTVEEVLGAPSTSGVADASGFYYVRSQFRHFAYLEAKEINRELVAVTFDGDGVVQNIERYGLEDGQTVVLSRRVTTNEGDGDGILQQLLRSLGNFVPSTL